MASVIGISFAVAQAGQVPNPGHSFSELQTCTGVGKILKINDGGNWDCADDATGGGGIWTRVDATKIKFSDGGRNAKVGIGTSIPQSPLEVVADNTGFPIFLVNGQTDTVAAAISNTGNGGGLVVGARTNSNTEPLLSVSNTLDGINVFRVLGDGSVCIGGVCRDTWPGDSGGEGFVGLTSNSYNGQEVGGYSGGDSKCNSAFAGSHMCSSADFGLYGHPPDGNSGRYSTFSLGGGSNTIMNDCSGWESSSNTLYSPWWTSTGSPSAISCNNPLRILCCR